MSARIFLKESHTISFRTVNVVAKIRTSYRPNTRPQRYNTKLFGYLQPSQQSLRLTAFEISLCQTNLMKGAHTSLGKQLTFGSRKIIVTQQHEPLQVIAFFQVVYFKALCNLKTHTTPPFLAVIN
jgi:hypothetical protein